MATKRMFSNIVIDSDSFLDLTPMQQLLYFHCGMKTDDDGFVSGAKRIARIIGAEDSDFAALVENGFLIDFPESKVFCIVHNRLNNDLKNDRYHPTNYQQEYQQLELTGNKEWKKKQPVSNMDTECIQPVSGMDTERSPTYPIVTYPNVTNVSVGKGSDEGETAQKLMLLLATVQHDGITSEVKAACDKYGVDAAHAAYTAWKDNNKSGKYNDYLKGE